MQMENVISKFEWDISNQKIESFQKSKTEMNHLVKGTIESMGAKLKRNNTSLHFVSIGKLGNGEKAKLDWKKGLEKCYGSLVLHSFLVWW